MHPLTHHEEQTTEHYRTFFAKKDLEVIELSSDVVEKALRLRVRYSLRTPDALQAACALNTGGDVTFLTGDKSFQRVVELQVELV